MKEANPQASGERRCPRGPGDSGRTKGESEILKRELKVIDGCVSFAQKSNM
jgi:hypothetical protein